MKYLSIDYYLNFDAKKRANKKNYVCCFASPQHDMLHLFVCVFFFSCSEVIDEKKYFYTNGMLSTGTRINVKENKNRRVT